ncbi:MAG: hypothetical protein IJA10_03540 [Lachnospiraceae bacterium]|nr:hypothetical protein [Lachnospiraceae bacterium]
MVSILVAIIFSVIAVLNILLIFGLPLGELTMGGQNKILPKNMRIMAIFSLPAQLFAIIIALQGGGYLGLWFSYDVTKIICYVFAGYMMLNTIMNFISKSKKEKYIMTPLSLIAAVCFFIIAWNMN